MVAAKSWACAGKGLDNCVLSQVRSTLTQQSTIRVTRELVSECILEKPKLFGILICNILSYQNALNLGQIFLGQIFFFLKAEESREDVFYLIFLKDFK